MPPKRRTRYAETPASQRISRKADGDAVIAVLEETIRLAADEQRRSRTRRLLMLQGEAGIGKTWFLDYLHERIADHQSSWRLINRYEVREFAPPVDNLYYRFLRLLKGCDQALSIACLPDLPDPTAATLEQVAEWTGLLEIHLTERHSQPLLLFFDEMEWWVGIPETEQATLSQLFRIVWAMLLRQAQLPIVFICAGRRIPQLKHPLLRLVQHNFSLQGFPAEQLVSLVQSEKQVLLLPLIKRYTEDNPWATQILMVMHTLHSIAFAAPVLSDTILQEIFEAIVDQQVNEDMDLLVTLYQLAQHRPAGFTANDPLLPQGDATLIKLMNSSFVEFHSGSKRYFVVPVLARWFKRSDHHDPH